MAKSVRMADIAEKLGVSIVTVSKALSGKDGVGNELRNNIIKVAEEMGYNTKKSDDEKKDSYFIGILNSYQYLEKGSSFYWSLYERLLTYLLASGDLGVLEVVSENDAANLCVPKIIQDKRVDGIIAMGPFPDDYLNMLGGLNIPLVALDSYKAKFNYDYVISDGYYGMYTMTDYLIRMGHKKIMFVGTVGETSSISDRFYGYCRAMRDAGIIVTEDMIIPDRDNAGKISVDIPVNIKHLATALVCNCDFTAYEVSLRLTAMGIKIPDDISIVGFDNYILSEMSNIKITTYAVDQDGMAAASVKQIRRRISNPQKNRRVKIVSGEILIRDSVKEISNL
ncbi:MAG: LacI family DNA-binding transcriptional regulator [Ruminococcus sp.]|jgi:DNA-binding LacI/PurR family transcriptional regulator|nr:LacI family DNA-binding transcriptional regulator [Ruminococcus sp.]